MILRSTDDVLDRFADAGLRLFDKANRYEYGDMELHEEFKKMAKVYLAELFMNATDEVMKS
jgi:aryl-alcohol dehydrogenase-like predicted oxidoreductase